MKNLILLAILAVFSFQASAGLDVKNSTLTWRAAKKIGSFHTGGLELKKSSLQVSNDQITGGSFVIDMTKFTVTDLKGEWKTKFLTHMKSDDFFNVEKFPEAKLTVKSVEENKINADLTIKGETNPVSFTYEKKGDAFFGKMVFDRTKFKMIYGSDNFFKNLGDKIIEDEVEVSFKLAFK